MFENWKLRNLRENDRGAGFLAHPLFIALILVIIVYAVLSFTTGTIVPRVGTIFILAGIFVVAYMKNLWGLGIMAILVITGGVLLYLNQVTHTIGF